MAGSRQLAGSRRIAKVAALALVALLVAACADASPTFPPPSLDSVDPQPEITPGTDIPLVDIPIPNGDTDTEQVLLDNADGQNDIYRSIGRLDGASLTCTLVLVDAAPGVTTGPAYALTNGHCLGINGNDTFTAKPLEGVSAVFDFFADVTDRRTVPVVAAVWASMKGTDLAILQLDTTVGELADAGYRPWPIEGEVSPDAESSLDVVIVGAPVGMAGAEIPEAERFLRLGTCSMDTERVLVNERLWLWDALRTDCPQVLPGNSGSPLIDAQTGQLVGLVNTTTYRGEQGAPCWLGRPCEVTEDGEDALPDTTYAMPLDALDGCFDPGGSFVLGEDCSLDPGTGIGLANTPVAVNPAAPDPISGERRTTWATSAGTDGDGYTHYAAKIVPLETGECADGAGYGDPVPVSTPIDDPLPTTEQRLLLCVVGGRSATVDDTWQPYAQATFAVVYVDTTPPQADIVIAKDGSKADGWRVEPVFDPPELSLYLQKVGPVSSTDCSSRAGYTPYRRQPLFVDPGGPWRYCALGFDDANNPSDPASVVLK